MTQAEIKQLIQKQRTFFHSDATLDVEYRIHALQKLKACILKYENEINIAIRADLGMCFESYMHVRNSSRPKRTDLYDKAYAQICERAHSQDSTGTVSLQELSKTVTVWCHTDYESMELSVHAHHRAVD